MSLINRYIKLLSNILEWQKQNEHLILNSKKEVYSNKDNNCNSAQTPCEISISSSQNNTNDRIKSHPKFRRHHHQTSLPIISDGNGNLLMVAPRARYQDAKITNFSCRSGSKNKSPVKGERDAPESISKDNEVSSTLVLAAHLHRSLHGLPVKLKIENPSPKSP